MITTGTKRYSCLLAGNWQFFVVVGNVHYDQKKKINYDQKKKRYSRLSDGCAVLVIMTIKKKDTVVCLLGARFWRLRPEKKKDTVVCLAGCAVVSVFGFGGKLAVFLLWRESFITTGKKRYSRLSGGCAIIITTGKKRYSRVSGGCAIITMTKKKIQSSVWQRNHYTTGKKTVVCLAVARSLLQPGRKK